MDYLKLEHLSVGYNNQSVVDDINIDIKKGEIVALIGPNGAGKSTILKSIARELDIISGKIILDGRDIHKYSFKELSSKMAVILTERIKVELMTCRDIVATGRYPYTGRLGFLTEKDEEKINEALETVQAFDIAYKDFNRISDGQRQRILLARALCQEPEIILLDEPTSFLDVKHKLELLTILTNLARKKKITVLTSLHEIDLAEKVADRIVTVKGKELFGFGKPEEIFEESNIRELYDIKKGFFDPLLGNIELSKPEGRKPKVFVIAGGGTGIPVFRKLQKENIPFAAGILYTNDIDYRLARLLAAEVITEQPFEEISDETFERAVACMNSCEKIINTAPKIGKMNKKLEELINIAEKRQEEQNG